MKVPLALKVILSAITGTVILLLIAPSVMLLISSFNTDNTYTFPPTRLGINWYVELFQDVVQGTDGGLFDSLVTSVNLSLTTAIAATVVGSFLAYSVVRGNFIGRRWLDALTSLPLVFPAVSLGIGFVLLFNDLGWDWTYGRIWLALVVINIPFVYRNVKPTLEDMSSSMEEAAAVLGAGQFRTMVTVVFPIARPGIFAGFLLSFILAFNEITIVFFIANPPIMPFSLWVFQQTEAAFNSKLAAVASIVLVLNLVLLWVGQRIMGKGARFGF